MVLYVVAIGWMFVVVLMAAAEAASPSGSLLGALVTLVFYGVLPLALVLYLLGTPARRRALRAAEAASAPQPDGRGHAAGDAVAAKREEP
jgi:membrane protein implicated in regulation of membrane protease activity